MIELKDIINTMCVPPFFGVLALDGSRRLMLRSDLVQSGSTTCRCSLERWRGSVWRSERRASLVVRYESSSSLRSTFESALVLTWRLLTGRC